MRTVPSSARRRATAEQAPSHALPQMPVRPQQKSMHLARSWLPPTSQGRRANAAVNVANAHKSGHQLHSLPRHLLQRQSLHRLVYRLQQPPLGHALRRPLRRNLSSVAKRPSPPWSPPPYGGRRRSE
ncbi:unnamed protein product [Colias eurytheme]|nr:unnamed protein product [Colias eurytheme]